MKYVFRYRRKGIWKKATVIGHRLEKDLDKMVLYFEDGSIQEIAEWSKCDLKLGVDWVLAAKKDMEKKAAQAIPLDVNAK